MDLEEVWRIREEDVYPALFGPCKRGIFVLQMEMFTGQFKQTEVDPRWLHHGVIEYAPTDTRRSWLYVTSGYSNPWEEEPEEYDPNGQSGSGVEFTFATTEPGDWAIITLQSMLVFDILLCAGRFPGREGMCYNDRIPLRAPVNGDPDCVLRNMIMTEPEGIPGEFQLPSGEVLFTGFTAISDSEMAAANESGAERLINRLREEGFHPVTDPHRKSVM